jgi:hypothetical protein
LISMTWEARLLTLEKARTKGGGKIIKINRRESELL